MSYYICYTDTFIENYSVNKEKPEMHCDGKCKMLKPLEQNKSENDKQKGMMLMILAEIIFYLSFAFNLFSTTKFTKDSKKIISRITNRINNPF